MYMFQFIIVSCLFILLVGFCRVFHRRASFNYLCKLLELSVCSLIFDLLLFLNLSMINPSLQPLFQLSSLMSIDMLMILSSLPDSES